MQSDAKNPEVQNRYTAAAETGRPGPSISFSGNEANPLFHNTGKGFAEIGTTLGLSRIEDSRGLVLVDLDDDGAQDVVLHNYFRNPIVALLNRAAGENHWIRLRLRGIRSNRFGIGARVTVNGRLQELACGSGYQSGNAPELHFGLGRAAKADITVKWPSGEEDVIKGCDADRVLAITEGEAKALRSEELKRVVVEPDAPAAAPKEPDVRAVLKGLWSLENTPAPVEAPAVVIFFSIDCHTCIRELQRIAEIQEQARRAGIRTVWVTVDADFDRVLYGFQRNNAPVLPLRPTGTLGPLPTPSVYLVTPDRLEKFTGRFAVTAALESAARLKK